MTRARTLVVGLVAALALLVAGCGGGGDDSTSNAGASTSTQAPAGSTGGEPGATDGPTETSGDGEVNPLDADCQFLLAGAYMNPAAAATPAGDLNFGVVADQFDAMADAAPGEIKGDFRVVADAFSRFADVLGDGIDFSNPQSFMDPEVQQKLSQLEDVFTDEYEAAADAIRVWAQENC